MRDDLNWHGDETKCDHCGTQTPRLDPPQDIELCDACWRAQEQAAEIKANNDATYQRAIRRFFGLDDRASRKVS